jgi:hypothetical protein
MSIDDAAFFSYGQHKAELQLSVKPSVKKTAHRTKAKLLHTALQYEEGIIAIQTVLVFPVIKNKFVTYPFKHFVPHKICF